MPDAWSCRWVQIIRSRGGEERGELLGGDTRQLRSGLFSGSSTGGIHLLGKFRARRISRPASAAFGIERVCGLTVFGCGPLFGISRGC